MNEFIQKFLEKKEKVKMTAEDQLAKNGGKPVRTTSFPPWPNYGEEEIRIAEEVLRSGKFSRLSGTKVLQFENAFAQKHGVKHAVAVSSGTAAIHVALAALGIGPGDDVIHTSHCFIGTATPSAHAGAVPIFADIDPRTFNIDPKSIEEKITPYTKAIVPVHLNGCPADMDAILEIARKHNLFVVEDAAQATGALYKGKIVGTFGIMGCYSFWEDKLITTAGEGGMIITNDDELAKRARMIQNHGEEPEDGTYYAGERLYYHQFLGYNYRMGEFQGAVGLVQLGRLDEYIEGRRKNAHLLTQLLSEVKGIITPYEPPEVKHVFYKYIMRLDRNILNVSAKEFVAALQAEGIPCSRRYPTPLHQQPVFVEKRGFGNTHAPFTQPWYPGNVEYGSGLPNAEKLPEELVRLLMNSVFSPKDIEDMAKGVRKVAQAYTR
jgi:perosamine synthetase